MSEIKLETIAGTDTKQTMVPIMILNNADVLNIRPGKVNDIKY